MIEKLITVVGARPQFIKAAAVSRALSDGGSVSEQIIHTGQHFDANMSAIFFEEMEIPKPAHHLGIGGGTHGQNTGRALEAIETILLAEKPDAVMVYGDTDSTLAGALAAAKLHIPIIHVEAGLRSFNRRMPEEINRILTDHISALLFAPSAPAVANLKAEGAVGVVSEVGDVMFDAVLRFTALSDERSDILETLGLAPRDYVLATLHRAENVDDPQRLAAILAGFSDYGGTIILPLHPRTRARLRDFGIEVPANVRIIDPVGYLDMLQLESRARAIATDSGGVQKEAYFHRVPCVTLRDETEWVELVEVGANRLTGADSGKISEALESVPASLPEPQLYGRGEASGRIAAAIADFG